MLPNKSTENRFGHVISVADAEKRHRTTANTIQSDPALPAVMQKDIPVHDLAKQYGFPSKVVLERAQMLFGKGKIRSHASLIHPAQAERLVAALKEAKDTGEAQSIKIDGIELLETKSDKSVMQIQDLAGGGRDPALAVNELNQCRNSQPLLRDQAKHSGEMFIVDGSNVCRNFTPNKVSLAALLSLLVEIQKLGAKSTCYCDANLRHVIREECAEQNAELVFETLLTVTDALVQIPACKQADDMFLFHADKEELRVVSNDSFLSYQRKYSWLKTKPERRICGMVTGGVLKVEQLEFYASVGNDLIKLAEEFTGTSWKAMMASREQVLQKKKRRGTVR